MKRVLGLVLVTGLLASLGGCVYPAYQRPSVVYDDGTVGGDSYDGDYAYSSGYVPNYYAGYGYGYGYYDPWYYGYGPFIGLGFYGSYRFGGFHHGYGHGYGGHGSHGSSSGSSGSHHGH